MLVRRLLNASSSALSARAAGATRCCRLNIARGAQQRASSSIGAPARLKDWMADHAAGADPKACEVLEYWFGSSWAGGKFAYEPAKFQGWFQGGAAKDEEIKAKFLPTYQSLVAGELDGWLSHPANALAGVIVLDQFSRNMFRDTPQMYAADPKALAWTNHILDTGLCASLPFCLRGFLIMPFEHSEALEDQRKAVSVAEGLLNEVRAEIAAGAEAPEVEKLLSAFLLYAKKHLDVVEKWGRFPHRNKILGRESTPEELAGFAAGTIASF